MADQCTCKSYTIGIATLVIHCHVAEEYWYEVVVTRPGSVTRVTRVCSEYRWENPANALAAAMAQLTEIQNPLSGKWDDRKIPGAVRRVGTA